MEKLEYYKKKYGDIHYKLQLLKDVQKFQDLYADLYFFEVYLKYNIDREFAKHFGTDWKEYLRFWKSQYAHKNFLLHNEITLGFWVALFNTRINQYDGKIKIKNIFKDINLGFNKIYTELKDIRDFRNAIFHFNAETYIDEIPKYKKLIQKYIVSLSCDDIFLDRNILDSNALKNKVEKEYIKNCTKLYNNVDIVYYTSTEHELKKEELNKIVNEEQMQEFERMHGYFEGHQECYERYCEEERQIGGYDEQFWDRESWGKKEQRQIKEEQDNIRYIEIDHTVIKKIKNSNNDIKIIVTDFRDVTSICHKELAIDNKKIFITTPKELPNLLNTIQNDNAN